MLSKTSRLRTRSDFDYLWKRGRAVYGRGLGIRFAPLKAAPLTGFARRDGTVSRFGVIAGLKVSKRATKRNLLRRRIREALRREFHGAIRGFDVVVIAQPASLNFSYQDVVIELAALFRRARLL